MVSSAPRLAMSSLPQTQIGKYRLLRKIASGGMAEVYLAQAAGPAGFQKTLVLKRILPHLVEDPAFVEMFLNEARLAALLNHPNIVQIFDLGEADGSYFIAMEHIDGPNLRALCRRASEAGKVVPLEQAAKIISLACEGLGYAHDFSEEGRPLNLIHRDISPDNVMLSRTGAVKVVDFGIAKAANQGHLTKTGTLKGKLAYMPPEQLRGKPLDRRADIFALGVVLYELVAGMKPFDATSEIASMQAILHDPPTPLNERRLDCPAELVVIVERALQKDREDRYPDCRAMQRDLESFLLTRRTAVGAYELAELVSDILPAAPQVTPGPQAAVLTPIRRAPTPPAPAAAPTLQESATVVGPAAATAVDPPAATASTPAPTAVTGAAPAVAPTTIDPAPARSGRSGLIFGTLGLAAAAAMGGYVFFAIPKAPPVEPVAVVTPPPAAEPAKPPAVEPAKPPAVAEPAKPPTVEEPPATPPEPTAPDKPTSPQVEPVVDARPDKPAAPEKAPVRPKPPRGGDRNPPPAKPATPAAKPAPDDTKVAMADAPRKASLVLDTEPACSVTLDGRPAGMTPVEIKELAAGPHQVVLANREKGFTRTMTVQLAPGEERRERIKIVPGTLVFRVQPWAFVEVDGKPVGQTPIPAGVTVYEGEHRVRLYNPELKKEKVQQVQVQPGARETIKANFLDE